MDKEFPEDSGYFTDQLILDGTLNAVRDLLRETVPDAEFLVVAVAPTLLIEGGGTQKPFSLRCNSPSLQHAIGLVSRTLASLALSDLEPFIVPADAPEEESS